MDIGFIKSWNKETRNMNEGKVGVLFEYSHSYIHFLAFLKIGFKIAYRTVQGVVRGLSDYIKIEEMHRSLHNRCVACETTIVQLRDEDIELMEISAIREKIPSVRIIKAIHVDGSQAPLQKLHNYDGIADALILDSVNLKEDRIVGTGMIHDWTINKKIVDNSHLPVILAGGLTPDNVQYATRSVGPYAVDVNSGVKITKTSRRKDSIKVRNFIYQAKNAT